MEYFNKVANEYLYHLKYTQNLYKIKIELLTFYETVIDEITKYIDIEAQGQININYQQITRRSCSLSICNIDEKYSPNSNRWFWLNRKFKLWIGVESPTSGNTYWFTQGVYYTLSVTGDSHALNIEGADKGCALDGALKTNMIDGQLIVESGATISQLIKRTLLLNDGVNPIDPIKPLIDPYFNDIKTQIDISLNDGEYIGDLISAIAEGYGADIYYDTNGKLNIRVVCDGQRVDGYSYQGIEYYFDDSDAKYSESSLSFNYDIANAVTVYTNISTKDNNGNDIDNVSYTAYNTNPKSPINIYQAGGIFRMPSVEVPYIDSLTPENMKLRCKQNADYLLLKSSLNNLSINFNCIIIPHLDVNKVICINDTKKGIDYEKYIIQSITVPLVSGEMTIEATNINVLPNDTKIEYEVSKS